MDFIYVIILQCSLFISFLNCGVIDSVHLFKDIIDTDSDIYLNSVQLIKKNNYLAEKHLVVTEDGYVLNIFRIPKSGPAVLLVHGIADSSDSWLVLGPEKSLAYRLANAGFDVWLYNSRGNRYSKDHIKQIPDDEYWNFSFEEMGSKDLPATIDYILSKTEKLQLSYVGFSQGTTIFFILCIMRPEYNEKIEHAVLLAPVSVAKSIKTSLMPFYAQNIGALTFLSEKGGVNEVFPYNVLSNIYHAKVCNLLSPLNVLCNIEYYLNFGLVNLNNLPESRLPIITSHVPAGASAKTFIHFLQGYVSKQFRRYDYGTDTNLKVYNTSIPPTYDLSRVTVPVTMFASESDSVSTVEDFQEIRNTLTNVSKYVLLNKSFDFTHLEFVYGKRVNYLINDRVIGLLENVVSLLKL